MLQVKDLNIYLKKDGRNIIQNFNFNLERGDKVALIGEEGDGKSTLLKVMCGVNVDDYATYSGAIVRKGRFCYLPQFLSEEDGELTIRQFFGDVDIYDGLEYLSLMELDFNLLSSERLTSSLSGGEKVKLQLYRLLCQKPDALFLDEPSNDLDIQTLAFLQNFINGCAVPVVYISHDSSLIESTANAIIHIEQLIKKTKCQITVSRLSYSEYLESRNLQFTRQTQKALKERAEHKKQLEVYRKLYEKAKNNTSWKNPDGIPSSDGHAKKNLQSAVARGKRLQREGENLTQIPDRETGIIARFEEDVFIPNQKRVLQLELPVLKVGESVLATNVKLNVTGAEHICIIGKNGAGKSTLLKRIYEQLKDRTDVTAGYMPQNYRDVLNFDKTPSQYFEASDKAARTKAMTMLGNLKFSAEEMSGKIGELSGGQQAKLIFLNMVLTRANVLVLDEPTRNFSPLSAPVVREALANFKGAIISVSHDLKYLEEVAQKIYTLTPEGLIDKI